MPSPETQLAFPYRHLIEHLQEEVNRLSNLLELAKSIAVVQREQARSLAALGRMGLEGKRVLRRRQDSRRLEQRPARAGASYSNGTTRRMQKAQ
jgi:hypothetical protein